MAHGPAKIVVTGIRYVRPYRDPWAQRIAAIAWPVIIVVCGIVWQRWLERVLPRLLARSDQSGQEAPVPAPLGSVRPSPPAPT